MEADFSSKNGLYQIGFNLNDDQTIDIRHEDGKIIISHNTQDENCDIISSQDITIDQSNIDNLILILEKMANFLKDRK